MNMFLACHLQSWNAADGCAFVYGASGEAVCTQQNLTFTKCNVTH